MRKFDFNTAKSAKSVLKMSAKYLLLLLLCTSLMMACSSIELKEQTYNTNEFYFISEPNQRQLNPDKYFKHEYKYINSRRGTIDSEQRPDNLMGIAFSGGGIRSYAFQLGMLAGLNSAVTNGQSILSRLDYISSVSGGSWANGEYWSSAQSDDDFFSCLIQYAENGNLPSSCEASPTPRLRNTQKILILPWYKFGLKQRKIAWEEDIKNMHIKKCNVDFSRPEDFKPCFDRSRKRPYPIFNSTHSAAREKANVAHDTFQTTPDYQGTISDRKGYQGFFVKSGSQDFKWEHRKWQRYFAIKGENRKDLSGTLLSLILAHSSGVVGSEKPFLLQYNFHARYKDTAIEGIRRTYHLADGGKSDNLGLIPLFERGVDTIIVSQMGKEGQDFGDIKLGAEQAEKLFGSTFKSDWPRDIPAVVTTEYEIPAGENNWKKGNLILVRPTVKNVADFKNHLKINNHRLYEKLIELDKNEKKLKNYFPETPTFRQEYPEALIRAYFLLGHYLATTSVKEKIMAIDS